MASILRRPAPSAQAESTLNMTAELEAAARLIDQHKRRAVSEMTLTGWHILSRAVRHLELRLTKELGR